MKAADFPKLWMERDKYIALFGIRTGRYQSMGRKLISAISRLMVKVLFGTGVIDVNTPYRLIQAKALQLIIQQIPKTTFAPNIIISGALAGAKLPIKNISVPHQIRQTGQISIVKWRLWRIAIKSFWQTLSCRFKIDLSDLYQFKNQNN